MVVEVSVAQYSRNLGSRPSCTLEVASEGTTLSSLEIVALRQETVKTTLPAYLVTAAEGRMCPESQVATRASRATERRLLVQAVAAVVVVL